tara:strand:- start:184 stop:567 length:384 start_codon:yes stop_codon:yes gene_type:complete
MHKQFDDIDRDEVRTVHAAEVQQEADQMKKYAEEMETRVLDDLMCQFHNADAKEKDHVFDSVVGTIYDTAGELDALTLWAHSPAFDRACRGKEGGPKAPQSSRKLFSDKSSKYCHRLVTGSTTVLST